MTVLPITQLGDPVLRTACDPVTRFDQALAQLVTDLLDTVREPGRAGLAAPQIGVSLAVFLNPTRPCSAAGMRIDPPVSEPSAAHAAPQATDTEPPEVEPPGMRMAQGDSERVRRIRRELPLHREQRTDHVRDLRLLRATKADDGELHRTRRVLEDRLDSN